MKLTKALQTCEACPSQWDAWTDTGEYVYLRFRYGRGTATVYPSNDIDTWSLSQQPAKSFEFCDGACTFPCYCGEISLEEFCRLADIELALSS